MRERTKIIYRGWNKEIFILQGENIGFDGVRQMFNEFKRLYEDYRVIVIPVEIDFEFK